LTDFRTLFFGWGSTLTCRYASASPYQGED
jgi:hypothetical protein